MAVIELTEPLTMSNAALIVEADNYEQAVGKVRITPTTPVIAFPSIAPGGARQRVGTSSWVVELGVSQDWKTPASLARFLFENHGQTKTVKFRPYGATVGDPEVTAEVTILSPGIGGDNNAAAIAEVALPVDGQPLLGTIPL